MKLWLFVLPCAVSCAGVDPHSEESHNRKVMALQEKFDRFDYNADSHLTRAELEQGLRESDIEGVTARELDLVMKHYDVNDDDRISRWEVQHAIDSPLPDELENHE